MTVAEPPRQRIRVSGEPTGVVLDALSPTLLLALVKRYKWLLLAGILLGGGLGLLRGLTRPVEYTARARFIVNSGGSTSGGSLASLASQLGIATGGGATIWDSPSFYADLLTSRDLLWQAANAPLRLTSDSTQTTTAISYLRLRSGSPGALKDVAVQALQSYVDPNVVANGVIELKVTTGSPEFSSALASVLIDALNKFNFDVRQARIAAERQFIERRMEMAQGELRAAENQLKQFLEANRQYQNSPDLRFRYDRLASEVQLRQQLFSSALLLYENAKIEQIRDTPMTSVIEAPDVPLRSNAREIRHTTIVGAAAGFVLAAFIVLVLDLRRRVQRELQFG